MMLLATALALGTTACTLNFGSGREDGDSGADTQTETTVFAEYTLYAPSSIAVTFLIDKEGEVEHTWESEYSNHIHSAYLLESSRLLRTGTALDRPSVFNGAAGGVVEILDWNSNVIWSAIVAGDDYLSHHDAVVLPNNNVLVLVWEVKTAEQVMALGHTGFSGDTLWAGAVYEICRANAVNTCEDGEIVWRWSAWDHVIQDADSSIAETYVDDIANHPDKINLNYQETANPDWMHANSIDYHPARDLILIGVHNFNEYWVIDRGDATQGIQYRYGNPGAYDQEGEQILFGQHDVQWITSGLPGEGNIILFNNGVDRPGGAYSTIEEICHLGDCLIGTTISRYGEGPDGDFYSSQLSGVQRLENGNTLVTEGVGGRLFEYNPEKEIVWEFDHGANVFGAHRYSGDYPGLFRLLDDD